MKRRTLLSLVGAGLLAGCATPAPVQYAAERPLLDLRRYFDGELEAWGMFTDRAGAIVKRFRVKLHGHWHSDSEGVLEEDFTFSDGTLQRRVWQLSRGADGRWRGRADDVIGEAIGELGGNTLRWRYTLALPVDGRTWHVDFDDWMVLVDDKVLLNRAGMSKFGVRLGEVVLAFRKP